MGRWGSAEPARQGYVVGRMATNQTQKGRAGQGAVGTPAAPPGPPRPAAGPEDDPAFVARLRAGDGAAFEEVVRLHAGRMLAVARRLLGDEDEAQDAVQEAFLSAFRSIERFEGGSRVSTWLHRIVVNASLMRMRSRKRRREKAIEDLLPAFQDDGHHKNPPGRWRETPSAGLESEETRAVVRARIDELPEAYRIVLVLRDIEGLDTEETAKLLEMTTGAVKTRLHRARLALRELLEPHFAEEST